MGVNADPRLDASVAGSYPELVTRGNARDLEQARSAIGKTRSNHYSLLLHNCETFTNQISLGRGMSAQVRDTIASLLVRPAEFIRALISGRNKKEMRRHRRSHRVSTAHRRAPRRR